MVSAARGFNLSVAAGRDVSHMTIAVQCQREPGASGRPRQLPAREPFIVGDKSRKRRIVHTLLRRQGLVADQAIRP